MAEIKSDKRIFKDAAGARKLRSSISRGNIMLPTRVAGFNDLAFLTPLSPVIL